MTPEEAIHYKIQVERDLFSRSLPKFVIAAWPHIEGTPYLHNWHIDAMCELLTAVSKGQIRNLLINIPPGCMKSALVSTLWPAWDWTRNGWRKFLASTYSGQLSNKNAQQHRDLVKGAWYQDRWPEVNITRNDAAKVERFRNTQKGERFSTSVTGTATGFHGHIIIWDDLVNAKDATGKNAITQDAIKRANDFRFKILPTRRADPATTAFVGVMQRLHYADPSQICIDRGDHVILSLPMEYESRRKCVITLPQTGKIVQDPRTKEGQLLWPARFPRAEVEQMKDDLGSDASAQLQQDPQRKDGVIFKDYHFGEDRRAHPPASAGEQIITVDASFKDKKSSDFVAIQVWRKSQGKFYLCAMDCRRLSFTKTVKAIESMVQQWPNTKAVYIEDKANGTGIIDVMQDHYNVIGWNPGRDSKESRAEACSHLLEGGKVFFPHDKNAPWMRQLVSQATKFPLAPNDDMVDAMTMALLILHNSKLDKKLQAYAKLKR